jgi:hypothetical protein
MLSRLLEFLPVSSGYTTAKVFPWPVKLETAGGLDWSLEVKSFPFDESEPNYDSRGNAWPDVLETTTLRQRWTTVNGTLDFSAPFTADSLSAFVDKSQRAENSDGSVVGYNLVLTSEAVVLAYQVFPSPNPSEGTQDGLSTPAGPDTVSLNTHQWYLVAALTSRNFDENPPQDGTYIGTHTGILILADDSDAALSMRTKFDQLLQELAPA